MERQTFSYDLSDDRLLLRLIVNDNFGVHAVVYLSRKEVQRMTDGLVDILAKMQSAEEAKEEQR